MLVCAPTGAGKTNIALMTICNEVSKNLKKVDDFYKVESNTFKIIYISPMKALASEIVQKFSERLNQFNVYVKEYTGDMQLSKSQVEQTHVIVTTPEKWDVVTRKTNTVSEFVRLIIIDEIHLLNDDRGPVLESLVTRTLQNIERAQKRVRLVGLSATLPNYLDVGAFLNVKKEEIFYFDSTFRPVPLLQKFIGVREPKNKFMDVKDPKTQKNMRIRKNKKHVVDQYAYKETVNVLKINKQVLVFVHSRNETVKGCWSFVEQSIAKNEHLLFSNNTCYNYGRKAQDKELQKLIPNGVGFHHAGMQRKDKNLVEALFQNGVLRVLFATATLAWGVNMPAYTVIIKGTDIYDAKASSMKDLGILDVQQMFGRAGRPQYDNTGQAILITDIQRITHYISQMNNTAYIESKFMNNLNENLNAEICLGNISNYNEAFHYLNHSFYAIRLRRSPQTYGLQYKNEVDYEIFLNQKIMRTLDYLDSLKLIRFDRKSEFLNITELGRITSYYYINCNTMDVFCKRFNISGLISDENDYYSKSELQILMILAEAQEFEQIQVRSDEQEELKNVLQDRMIWFLDEQLDINMKKVSNQDNIDENHVVIENRDKVIALIIGYLAKCQYTTFSLYQDTMYIVQNSIRIMRCILELNLKKNIAYNIDIIHNWCKHLEQKTMHHQSCLRQFTKECNELNNFKGNEKKDGYIATGLVQTIEKKHMSLDDIFNCDNNELSNILRCNKSVCSSVKQFCSYIPKIEVDTEIKPIAQTVIKVQVVVTPKFNFNSRWHSSREPFLLIVDNEIEIIHQENFTLAKDQIIHKQTLILDFYLPLRDSNNYNLKITSDSWIMDDIFIQLDINSTIMQQEKIAYTELLDLSPLPVKALQNQGFIDIYKKYQYFNPNQTQVFFSLYNTDNNILIGSPTGSGKTVMCEFAILKLFRDTPNKKVVYIAPMKSLAKERLNDWTQKFAGLKKTVLELTGDHTPDLASLIKADILITTPEKWDGISRSWNQRKYVLATGLVIFDEIHLLGQDRGGVIEVIVSRMNYIQQKTNSAIRLVGLSTAMANGTDVSEWFNVKKGFFYNFRPHVRPVPLQVYFDGFETKAYCPRMATMNKPCHNSIQKFSDGKPVLVFVSSRRQTRLTALDLIAHNMSGNNASSYILCSVYELEQYIDHVQDEYLKQTLNFGIGMHHAGLSSKDREIVESLFQQGKIQVLIATSTVAWGVNFPARLVIIKGTEFFCPKTKRYVDMPVTDILQMMGRAGRPQFDDKGIACVFVEQSKKNFYMRYLNDPFPIESSLRENFIDYLNAEIYSKVVQDSQECMEWVTWTYYFRRVIKNPSYYGIKSQEIKDVKKFLSDLISNTINQLINLECIQMENQKLSCTFLGDLASFYYLKPQTVFSYQQTLNKGQLDIQQVLRLVSYSIEFDQMPLRHNEDIYNEQLSTLLPLMSTHNFDSPFEKTYYLMQMQIFRAAYPVRDYLTDMKIGLENVVRMIYCVIDLAVSKNQVQTLNNAIIVVQMLQQGKWHDQDILANIPNMTPDAANMLIQRDLGQLAKLAHFYRYNRNKLEEILGVYIKEEMHLNQALKSIKNVPICQLYINIDERVNEIKNNSTISLQVRMVKINGGEDKVIIQNQSKVKEHSYWVLVLFKDIILACNKIGFNNKREINKDISIQLPEDFEGNNQLVIYLKSDSYLGIDMKQILNLK